MINFINYSAGFAHRLSRGIIPRSLISFLMVGALGTIVHLTIMKIGMGVLGFPFRPSYLIAMVGAATFNYYLNNAATFGDKALRGRSILVGYALYIGVTSFGLVISMTVASAAYAHGLPPIPSAICGIGCGSLWNYFMSYTFVWRLIAGLIGRRSNR